MTFGEKLLKLRKEKGMSQEALAQLLNTSRQAVSKWENDQGFPETEKLLMIGNIFDVSTDYLLKDETILSDNVNEKGFYASREVVEGYIISGKKMAKLPSSGVFLLVVFAFQLIFRTDKYKALVNQPLVFDNNFLKEFKENYLVQIKKYIGMIIFSFVLIFGGVAIAVSIMIYAAYMMIIHNGIMNSNKRI